MDKPNPLTPVTFTLTEKDINRYTKMIEEFPLESEQEIIARLPAKLKGLVIGREFSSFVLELINDIEILYETLDNVNDLSKLNRKRILFALNYFIKEEDEVPDSIGMLGYVDDLVIVRWIINEVIKSSPGLLPSIR
ncbi:MAG: YkvA family protein [Candidatus Marinimicrobia bacterium]|jgi:hypothetical protein|nr:YkvA family protein [Candidatus Neomarinimicrobiota bacterium]MDP6593948.1 YkvA family protein [Candidatus Neomarinimicrobiota bacterium]MDP6836746.1 YkvA family protein [Candidatus Neomarinimicrobiota bacterium]MDP6966561.1 YkvA family protein [Candidatus Neomarinimicrobiota bacterium]|tara:strand:+ start:1702 stop:2109 length:408 start_codon:yes stop_codon:yes gene_type:complete